MLLTPETVTVLNGTGAAILGLCDGQRTVAEIVAELRGRYDRVADDEVRHFLDRPARQPVRGGQPMDRPFGLLAELTYACPLHCPYCSNPLNLAGYGDELTTAGVAAGAGRGPGAGRAAASPVRR